MPNDQQYAAGFAIAAAGPAMAAILTNPADVAKTRLAMQRELQPSKGARMMGSFECMQQIWAREGFAGLQRGLWFAMFREATKNIFRIGCFEPILSVLHDPKTNPGPPSFANRLLAGAGGGAISALVCNPIDLTKTRLQLEASHSRGTPAGASAAQLVAQVVREEGVLGLWRGTIPTTIMRSTFGGAVLMGVHAQLKEPFASHLPSVAMADASAALVAGAACVVVINPTDVLRTRLYSQPITETGAPVLYKGVVDCTRQVVATEGFQGLYKGAMANFYRMGPHWVLTITVVGWMKRALL
jgi:solute carrier family 25 protein 34/35